MAGDAGQPRSRAEHNRLTLKAYTKGEHVLRFEVVLHNAKELGCGRVLQRFPPIVARLSCILERFLTTLDCVDVAFISDDTLDQLPRPSTVGKVHVDGIDLNNQRMRAALSAVLALTMTPMGFGVAQFRAKVQSMTGQAEAEYTPRHAAYDLKKLRGKQPRDTGRLVNSWSGHRDRIALPNAPARVCPV